MDKRYKISDIKVSIVKTQSAGADYTDHAAGHWINDTIIANPMSIYPAYQDSRSSWGMDAIKGIFIEIFTEGGHHGFATAFGGYSKLSIQVLSIESNGPMFVLNKGTENKGIILCCISYDITTKL